MVSECGMKWLVVLAIIFGVLASGEDLWRRRVSNPIALGAFLSGLIAHTVLEGLRGAGDALAGSLIGFVIFLVFYLLGGMGGGDVKLMAGFGAILGVERILIAAIMAALIGGLMALGYLLVKVVRRWVLPPGVTSGSGFKDSIPYAPAISLGVVLSFLSDL